MKYIFFFLVPLFLMVNMGKAQNVGIGTPSPVEKLQVEGGIKVGYTTSPNSQGTIRSAGDNLEYNNGFNWRALVNYHSMAEIPSLSPLLSTARNTWVQVPGAELTISTPGNYLIIFSIGGYSNGVYSLGGMNWDEGAQVEFRMNGLSILKRPRRFIVPEYSYQQTTTNRIDYFESPVEHSSVQQISGTTTFSIYAMMSSQGSPLPSSQWVVDDARIIAIRLN